MLFDHYDWSAAAFCREYMLPYGKLPELAAGTGIAVGAC
jgi:hypothetical protein